MGQNNNNNKTVSAKFVSVFPETIRPVYKIGGLFVRADFWKQNCIATAGSFELWPFQLYFSEMNSETMTSHITESSVRLAIP